MENDYQRRYAHATALLDDMRRAAEVATVAQRLAQEPSPAGVVLDAATSMGKYDRVGLLSGSFNPLTRAHIALGEAARTEGALDGILWTVPVIAIEKEAVRRAALVDRLLQMEAFVGNGPDAWALANRGLYVDLARITRTLLPQLGELVIIVGFDKIVQILDPRYYHDRTRALDELFGLASFLVAPRAGNGAASLRALLRTEDNQRYRTRIAYCPLSRRYRFDSSTQGRSLTIASMGSIHRQEGRRLLAPEGLALATLPDVYGPKDSAHAGDTRPDAYDARLQAIERLRASREEEGVL